MWTNSSNDGVTVHLVISNVMRRNRKNSDFAHEDTSR